MTLTRLMSRWIACPLLALALSSCATQETTPVRSQSALLQARQTLTAALNQCTQRYGYDPKNVSGLAEHALAPTELQWRQCAYDAIRAYEPSNPPLASRYEQLIAEDIQMTLAIQQGTVTRAQRQARIDNLVAQIKAVEDAEIKEYQSDRELHTQQVIHSLYGFSGGLR